MKESLCAAMVVAFTVFAILVWHEALSALGVFGAWR